MARNWPPTDPYPSWPPDETGPVLHSTLKGAIEMFLALGFTRSNPTAQENQTYFRQVRCDHDDPSQGIMLVSPDGLRRYPFAYCTGADHKSALVLWVVGYTSLGDPVYDLGWGSGDIV